jgi:predicted amino acid racemase
MNKLIINLDQIAINTRFAKTMANARGYQLVGVLKAVQCHPRIIATLLGAGADSLGFSSIASVGALCASDLPDRMTRLLLGPIAPQSAGLAVSLFGTSIQSTLLAIDALGAGSRQQSLVHGVYLAVRTPDDREGVDPNNLEKFVTLALAILSNGLTFEGLACNLGCTTLEPLGVDFIAGLQALRAELKRRLGQEIALSLGGSFVLPDLPALEGSLSVRVGELLLSGSEPAGRKLLNCETGFRLEASVVEVSDNPTRVLVDVGSAVLEGGAFEICLSGATTISMSGEFMVIDADFPKRPQVGETVEFALGYDSLKKALSYPFLGWHWIEALEARPTKL